MCRDRAKIFNHLARAAWVETNLTWLIDGVECGDFFFILDFNAVSFSVDRQTGQPYLSAGNFFCWRDRTHPHHVIDQSRESLNFNLSSNVEGGADLQIRA